MCLLYDEFRELPLYLQFNTGIQGVRAGMNLTYKKMYRSDPGWERESAVAEIFDRGYEPPIQSPTTLVLKGKNRDICVCVLYISSISAKAYD